MWYEVDLRQRRTGNSIQCIYSGPDHDVAYKIMEEYNKVHVTGYVPVDPAAISYIGKDEPDELVADVYHLDDNEERKGVGEF